jgi:hypothetical protein
MEIIIESADTQRAKDIIGKVFSNDGNNITFQEDYIGFGQGSELLAIGVIFVWESITSGVTWDIIKESIIRLFSFSKVQESSKTKIYVYVKKNKTRYKIIVKNTDGQLDIEIPDGIKIQLTK